MKDRPAHSSSLSQVWIVYLVVCDCFIQFICSTVLFDTCICHCNMCNSGCLKKSSLCTSIWLKKTIQNNQRYSTAKEILGVGTRVMRSFLTWYKLIYFLDDASEYDTLHYSGTAVFPHWYDRLYRQGWTRTLNIYKLSLRSIRHRLQVRMKITQTWMT